MSFPPQGNKADVAGLATLANQTTLLSRLTAARALNLDELAAANIPADIDALTVTALAIKTITDSIAVLEQTGGTLTTDGNEQDVYINNAPDGVFRPINVDIDFTAHTATETVVIKKYRRIIAGGEWVMFDESEEFEGVQDPLGKTITMLPNRFGIKVTMKKTAGTNRAYIWGAYYAA